VATASVTATAYLGSVASLGVGGGNRTILLTILGAPTTAPFTDDDGVLGPSDNGIATFNGQPVTFIGSGVATPGLSGVLGVFVPLGPTVPLIVFSAGGQIYFTYPGAPPNLLGAVLLRINLTTDPAQLFTPICFAIGTAIETRAGPRPVEAIRTGDFVLTVDHGFQPVVWRGESRFDIIGGATRSALCPVLIRANAMGEGKPRRDLRVSPQHRILVSGWRAHMWFGEPEVLVPALALCNGETIRRDWGTRRVVYQHLLFERHEVLWSEGLTSESLLLGPVGLAALGESARNDLAALFPDHLRAVSPVRMRASRPVIRAREAVILAPGHPARVGATRDAKG